MTFDDTVAAISSAVGEAARMIVRLSGPAAHDIVDRLTQSNPVSAAATYRTIAFDGLTVPVWIYRFSRPRSYTGDDLDELHIPGNPLLARMLLEHLLTLGARSAEPGEFTARAYFNGRMDLARAEGVAATVAAGSEREARAARQLMAGELSRRLRPVMDLIAETLALTEVGIDFSEEDVTFLSAEEVLSRIERATDQLRWLETESVRFERLSHEPEVVLVGRPNAGKSTLLNALAGRTRAVVSPVAGTTRDALSVEIPLKRGMIRLVDLAGLEENAIAAELSPGPLAHIEKQMRARALRELESADVVVWVRDVTDEGPALKLPRAADYKVWTKIDLAPSPALGADEIAVSAMKGNHLNDLRMALDTLAFGAGGAEGSLALNARHLRAIAEARQSLSRARGAVEQNAAELVAADLRAALDSLGQILGAVSPDDVLGRIFSTFCIGK